MDIVFMGTPEFAVPCLKALKESGENISAVFTQPDKPRGRSGKPAPTPVKEYALRENIPVFQPLSLSKGEDGEEAYRTLQSLAPELIAVVAYGQLLPPRILSLPKTYCINIHASLLPKFRGAAPIQQSIISGEKVTGITSMIMGEGLDTGDMLISSSLEIGENETADELSDRLSALGAQVILETVKAIKEGNVRPVKQDDSLSSYAHKLTREMSEVDLSKPAKEVHNLIRGLSSRPGARVCINGRRLKVYRSSLDGKFHEGRAGEICDRERFTVICGDGFGVTFEEIQAEGGKRMKTADYLRGNKL